MPSNLSCSIFAEIIGRAFKNCLNKQSVVSITSVLSLRVPSNQKDACLQDLTRRSHDMAHPEKCNSILSLRSLHYYPTKFVLFCNQMTDGVPRRAMNLPIPKSHELTYIEGTVTKRIARCVMQLKIKLHRFSELLRTDS